MPDKHALLSASGSSRWLHCPPSALLAAEFKEKPSPYAVEGTKAHAMAEKKLRTWLATGKRPDMDEGDKAMDEYTSAYADYCIEVFNSTKAKAPDAEMEIEVMLSYSDYVSGGFGSGDCVITSGDVAHVLDLKYGKGVKVEAEGNSQLRFYGLGLIQRYYWLKGFESIEMHIIQPRLDHIATARMSRADLEAWAENEVRPIANLASTGQGNFKAGEWCRFCNAKGACKARAEIAAKELAGYEQCQPESLDPKTLAEILGKADAWASWIEDVKKYALDEALHGAVVPGWKLVAGTARRTITDPKKLAAVLESGGYTDIWKPVQMKPLTDLEKMVGKKTFGELAKGLIHKPAGKPTLVPASDKRKELSSVEDDFKGVNEDE